MKSIILFTGLFLTAVNSHAADFECLSADEAHPGELSIEIDEIKYTSKLMLKTQNLQSWAVPTQIQYICKSDETDDWECEGKPSSAITDYAFNGRIFSGNKLVLHFELYFDTKSESNKAWVFIPDLGMQRAQFFNCSPN